MLTNRDNMAGPSELMPQSHLLTVKRRKNVEQQRRRINDKLHHVLQDNDKMGVEIKETGLEKNFHKKFYNITSDDNTNQ